MKEGHPGGGKKSTRCMPNKLDCPIIREQVALALIIFEYSINHCCCLAYIYSYGVCFIVQALFSWMQPWQTDVGANKKRPTWLYCFNHSLAPTLLAANRKKNEMKKIGWGPLTHRAPGPMNDDNIFQGTDRSAGGAFIDFDLFLKRTCSGRG